MTRRRSIGWGIVFVAGVCLWIFLLTNVVGPAFDKESVMRSLRTFFRAQQEESSELFIVKKVVDGDTIELSSREKVRYIGIDTPETVKPNTPVQCFAKEASARNKELVEGKRVRLEKGISDRDKYGRLLRYVYLEDGTFVNESLVREGYAYRATFPPDVKFESLFQAAEREAREAKRGLWAPEACLHKK